ncbi:efflux RND transporter periplasmic adaptor subunit [Pseudomonas sp. MYb185]|uniref:efflux RND transporter periplasmic adaptor subunit n=1 Tax=Pseudomonas sp. MYb185 TaxID=1848729 RepID=UPI000CFE29AD|nr:efflux RND transporter periplasmic adaptor subunit [Pseudomonas sp. MYb185]PRB80024.1 efflux transporter periplasmic adaptor subunit [Pseudomonas sp. MYb185]
MKTNLIISLLAISLASPMTMGQSATRPASAGVPVHVAEVRVEDASYRLDVIGQIKPLQQVLLRPMIEGVIDEVLFTDGQAVSKGDLLVRIDDRSWRSAVDEAQATRQALVVLLREAEQDLARYQSLHAREGALSQQRLAQEESRVAQLKAQLQGSDARLEASRIALSHTRLVSPLSGRVGFRLQDSGNLVRAGDSTGLVVVTQIDPVGLEFSVSQDLLPKVQHWREHGVTLQVLDQKTGMQIATGQRAHIEPVISSATGTFRIKAELDNKDEVLWPGQLVRVRLEVEQYRQATVIPSSAIMQGAVSPYVFRKKDDRVEVVPISLVRDLGERSVVAGELSVGEQVVVDGQVKLRDGAMVSAVVVDASPDGLTADTHNLAR